MVKENLKVIYNKQIALDTFEMKLESTNMVSLSKPGMFINISLNDSSKLLKRPISICQIDNNNLIITYKINGEGTKLLSCYESGTTLEAIGPLGNGFTLVENKKVLVVGGGIGVPPLLELSKNLKKLGNELLIILAFRNKESMIYLDEFKTLGEVVVTTDDGSFGFKGNALDYLNSNSIVFDTLYSCGPEILLKKLEEKYQGFEGYLSYEARMACGVGLCHGCVKGEKHYCVCTDGPVFNLGVIYGEC